MGPNRFNTRKVTGTITNHLGASFPMHVTSCIRCWYMCTSGCLSWWQRACWDSKAILYMDNMHTRSHTSQHTIVKPCHMQMPSTHLSVHIPPSPCMQSPVTSSSSCRTTAAAACSCGCMQEASTSSGLAHDAPMIHTRHTRHQRMVPWDTLPTQHTSSTTHTPVEAATRNAAAERHKQTQTPPAGAVTSPSKPQPLP